LILDFFSFPMAFHDEKVKNQDLTPIPYKAEGRM